VSHSWARAMVFTAALVASAALLTAQTPREGAKPQATPAATKPRVEGPVPFQVGESLTYDVSWSQFLTAGAATVTVREKRPSFDSVAYYIVAEGQPTGLVARLYSVYYKVDTLLDAYSLLPQRGSIYSDESGHRRMAATRFFQTSRRATYEVKTATTVRRELTVPPSTHDPLSALYAIRALPLRRGLKVTLPVIENGSVSQVEIAVVDRQTIPTSLGRALTAWKITPTVRDGSGSTGGDQVIIWISDDAKRLPLRIDANLPVGQFVLALRETRG
jgi:Protein of unknown function (DUF3108)